MYCVKISLKGPSSPLKTTYNPFTTATPSDEQYEVYVTTPYISKLRNNAKGPNASTNERADQAEYLKS